MTEWRPTSWVEFVANAEQMTREELDLLFDDDRLEKAHWRQNYGSLGYRLYLGPDNEIYCAGLNHGGQAWIQRLVSPNGTWTWKFVASFTEHDLPDPR
jgi:hypothetical protein